MVKRFFHQEEKRSGKDDFIYVYLIVYCVLSYVRPKNQSIKSKLYEIKDRINELKRLKSVDV